MFLQANLGPAAFFFSPSLRCWPWGGQCSILIFLSAWSSAVLLVNSKRIHKCQASKQLQNAPCFLSSLFYSTGGELEVHDPPSSFRADGVCCWWQYLGGHLVQHSHTSSYLVTRMGTQGK